jgi:hypothetical protein
MSKVDELKGRAVQLWAMADQTGWSWSFLRTLGSEQHDLSAADAADRWCARLMLGYDAARAQDAADSSKHLQVSFFCCSWPIPSVAHPFPYGMSDSKKQVLNS